MYCGKILYKQKLYFSISLAIPSKYRSDIKPYAYNKVYHVER